MHTRFKPFFQFSTDVQQNCLILRKERVALGNRQVGKSKITRVNVVQEIKSHFAGGCAIKSLLDDGLGDFLLDDGYPWRLPRVQNRRQTLGATNALFITAATGAQGKRKSFGTLREGTRA